MNFESGLCKGCFRTLEEICNWSSYSETERENLFVKLKIRKEENVSKFNSEIGRAHV